MDRRGRPTRVAPVASRALAPRRALAVLAMLGLAACAGSALAVRRVVVEGDSMEPTLREGDRLLVARLPRRLAPAVLRPGLLVSAEDPRQPDRLLIKRVASVAPSGVELAGDNSAKSTDSRAFGPVVAGSVRAVALYRYAPAPRAGRLRPRHGPEAGASVR